MEPITQIIMYLLIGFFAGFTSGMFGIGGGSIRIPLLYASGLSLLNAFGINLLVIPFSSLVGAISHRKNVDFKIAKYVIVGGILGIATGAFLIGFIPILTLAVIFVIISILAVFGMYFERILPKIAQKINPSAKNITIGTFLINFVIIMRGGSEGSLFPPFLRMMKLDMRKAIATSLFSAIFTSIAGAAVFLFRGDIIFVPALWVIAGSVCGARIGSLMSLKTKPMWLEAGLSVLVVTLAFIVLLKTIW